MRNTYLVKLYVKLHYMWYYITHPRMWWAMTELRKQGRTVMQSNSNWDDIDYTKAGTWLGIMLGTGLVWYSIFTNGFFITITWLIVISAVLGIWLRVSGRG